MSKVRVSAFAVSLDGYSAGPRQGLENPLGVGGPELFERFFSIRTWQQMHGETAKLNGRAANVSPQQAGSSFLDVQGRRCGNKIGRAHV